MSKTIAELARLLSANNEQLFDRYINFRLTQKGPVIDPKVADFEVKTPAAGIKPNITVSGSLHTQNNANLITLTVVNMNANIDTMAYDWCEIEVGYTKSKAYTKFAGEVTNCYMAKPNPNGELVLSIVNAKISDMFAHGDFDVSFNTSEVSTVTLIRTCVDAMKAKQKDLSDFLDMSNVVDTIPAAWTTQTFQVAKATYSFRSPMACLTWLNSLFASYTLNTGFDRAAGNMPLTKAKAGEKVNLPPLRLGFDIEGYLTCRGSYSKAFPGTTKSLYCICSAFLTGTASATVTAPFNPDIAPGEVIFIDTDYFKTRVTANAAGVREAYAAMGNLWYVIEISFTFSTQTSNTMTLLLNNIKNEITSNEG